MGKVLNFRATKKAEDIINKYMGIHKIANRSLAINRIIESFQSEPRITQGRNEATEPTYDWVCVRGLRPHSNPEQQKMQCEVCRVRYHKQWRQCREEKLRSL